MLGQRLAQSKEVLPCQAIKYLLTVLLRIDEIYQERVGVHLTKERVLWHLALKQFGLNDGLSCR